MKILEGIGKVQGDLMLNTLSLTKTSVPASLEIACKPFVTRR